VHQHALIDEGTFSIEAVLQRRRAERALADEEYAAFKLAIRLTIGNKPSISWGDGKLPEGFMSFYELSNQLELLRIAEERTRGVGAFANEQSQDESEVA
jgi:hypothetical protein